MALTTINQHFEGSKGQISNSCYVNTLVIHIMKSLTNAQLLIEISLHCTISADILQFHFTTEVQLNLDNCTKFANRLLVQFLKRCNKNRCK